MYINVLGEKYRVVITNELKEDCLGVCDKSVKEIAISDIFFKKRNCDEFLNKIVVARETVRHEIVHAFHLEAGIDSLSELGNEGVVEWIAFMLPKITKTLSDAEKELEKMFKEEVKKWE